MRQFGDLLPICQRYFLGHFSLLAHAWRLQLRAHQVWRHQAAMDVGPPQHWQQAIDRCDAKLGMGMGMGMGMVRVVSPRRFRKKRQAAVVHARAAGVLAIKTASPVKANRSQAGALQPAYVTKRVGTTGTVLVNPGGAPRG